MFGSGWAGSAQTICRVHERELREDRRVDEMREGTSCLDPSPRFMTDRRRWKLSMFVIWIWRTLSRDPCIKGFLRTVSTTAALYVIFKVKFLTFANIGPFCLINVVLITPHTEFIQNSEIWPWQHNPLTLKMTQVMFKLRSSLRSN